MRVSTGPPQTEVPDVVGETRDDAVAALARANLDARVVPIYSDKPENTVIGQDPEPGDKVKVDTRVRINVSKGVQPVLVPPVVGQPYDNAASTLEGAGFKVIRRNVESDRPADTVVGQSPAANTLIRPGSTITLNVSKGPKTSTVPDVTSLDEEAARQQLEASGFKVTVTQQPTTDPGQNGFVLSQDPAGGSQAPAGTTVTIVVGQFTP
jgi:serine/threonine-protein kinase